MRLSFVDKQKRTLKAISIFVTWQSGTYLDKYVDMQSNNKLFSRRCIDIGRHNLFLSFFYFLFIC